MKWNYFIRLALEQYLDIGITNGLRLTKRLIFENWFESLTSVIAIFFAVNIATLPFGVMIFLIWKHRQVHDNDFQTKWGTLATDLKKDSMPAVFYTAVFLFRRLYMTLVIVLLSSYYGVQIHLAIV